MVGKSSTRVIQVSFRVWLKLQLVTTLVIVSTIVLPEVETTFQYDAHIILIASNIQAQEQMTSE